MEKKLFVALGIIILSTGTFTFADEVKPICTNTGAICQLRQKMQLEIATAKADLQTQTQLLKTQVKTNNELLEANRKSFKANFSGAKTYLSKPLTADKKLLVDEIITAKETAMQSLQTSTNSLIKSGTSIDRSGYITQAELIITTFRTNLIPYIDSSKVSAFDSFIQSKINSMISNVSIRQNNDALKVNIGAKVYSFKERLNQKKIEHKNTIENMKLNKSK